MASSDQMKPAFRRAFAAWPSYAVDSDSAAWDAWLSLAADERSDAATRVEDYVAACKAGSAKRCTFGVYLRERRWLALPAPEPVPVDELEPPFGPVWGAYLISCLLDGDPNQHVPALYRLARNRARHRFGDRIRALKSLMEAVPVQCEMFDRWRMEFEERGWSWIPDPGGQRVVYFPAGGPEGLQAFELAINGQKAEAAE